MKIRNEKRTVEKTVEVEETSIIIELSDEEFAELQGLVNYGVRDGKPYGVNYRTWERSRVARKIGYHPSPLPATFV